MQHSIGHVAALAARAARSGPRRARRSPHQRRHRHRARGRAAGATRPGGNRRGVLCVAAGRRLCRRARRVVPAGAGEATLLRAGESPETRRVAVATRSRVTSRVNSWECRESFRPSPGCRAIPGACPALCSASPSARYFFTSVHLRCGELRILGERVVDFLHLRRAVNASALPAKSSVAANKAATNLHGVPSPWSWPANRPIRTSRRATSISQPAAFASPGSGAVVHGSSSNSVRLPGSWR